MKTLYININNKQIQSNEELEVLEHDLDSDFFFSLGEKIAKGCKVENENALITDFNTKDNEEDYQQIIAQWNKLKSILFSEGCAGNFEFTLPNGYIHWLKCHPQYVSVYDRNFSHGEPAVITIDLEELYEDSIEDLQRKILRKLQHDDLYLEIDEIVFNDDAVTRKSQLVCTIKEKYDGIGFKTYKKWLKETEESSKKDANSMHDDTTYEKSKNQSNEMTWDEKSFLEGYKSIELTKNYSGLIYAYGCDLYTLFNKNGEIIYSKDSYFEIQYCNNGKVLVIDGRFIIDCDGNTIIEKGKYTNIYVGKNNLLKADVLDNYGLGVTECCVVLKISSNNQIKYVYKYEYEDYEDIRWYDKYFSLTIDDEKLYFDYNLNPISPQIILRLKESGIEWVTPESGIRTYEGRENSRKKRPICKQIVYKEDGEIKYSPNEFAHHNVEPFNISEGIYKVTFINNYGYALINHKGEYITNQYLQYKDIVYRANNIYEVGVYNRKLECSRYGLINNKGEIIVPCEYYSVIPIDDFYILDHNILVDKNLNVASHLPFDIQDYDYLNKQMLCCYYREFTWCSNFVIDINQKKVVLCIGKKIDENILVDIENLLKILNT